MMYSYIEVPARLLQGILAFTFNLITIISVTKFPKISPSDILITNLAVTDLLHGFAHMIFYPIKILYTVWPVSKYTCLCYIGFVLTTIGVQFNTLIFLSIERYCNLKAQIGQGRAWNKQITYFLVISSWLLFIAIVIAASITSPATQGDICMRQHYYLPGFTYPAMPQLIITLIVISIFYVKIAGIALKSNRNILPHDSTRRKQLKTQLRITKMIGMVVGFFFIFYFPVFLVGLTTITGFAQYPDGVFLALGIFHNVNFWLNPIIYAWRDKKFRKAIKTLLRCCGGCSCTTVAREPTAPKLRSGHVAGAGPSGEPHNLKTRSQTNMESHHI